MQKRYFETYQKRFRDFEILPKFSETHVFRGIIRHPSDGFVSYSLFRIFFSISFFHSRPIHSGCVILLRE